MDEEKGDNGHRGVTALRVQTHTVHVKRGRVVGSQIHRNSDIGNDNNNRGGQIGRIPTI